jgi:hypothetical protein
VRPPLLFPPKARMFQNFSDNRLLGIKRMIFIVTMPHGTLQRINLPYLLDAFAPGWRWDAPESVLRNIKNLDFITRMSSSWI